jgi:hypothetical protein
MFLMGDWGQQMDIEEQSQQLRLLRSQLRSANGRNRDTAERLASLEAQNGQLRLAVEALTRYLVSKGVIDSQEFGTLIESIDAEDGRADGKFDGTVV